MLFDKKVYHKMQFHKNWTTSLFLGSIV